MPRPPVGLPGCPAGPGTRFQLFGHVNGGPTRRIGPPVAAWVANNRLSAVMAYREPGEIFWLEKVQELAQELAQEGWGDERGVYKNYVASEHQRDQSQETPPGLRVCAATQYRKSSQPQQTRRPRIKQGLVSVFEALLFYGWCPRNTLERWIIGLLVALWGMVLAMAWAWSWGWS